ncbi:MAG TPA: phosphoribosylglycinamide formyltransferase [Acidimicrobiales bacterium]|nr:phosphoribosylglycinamide formyltransferase [Acidimicrobiales bacterium]
MRIGALASGTGTILESLVDAGLPISVVVVDRACGAEKIAERAGIAVERVVRSRFDEGFDRGAYTDLVVAALARHEVDVVVMAGYGTVLGPSIHERWAGRVLNTHPALLPSFKGWHAVADALAAGVKVTGCTVHLATLEVDDGPILAQEAVPVLDGDTVETLHERIKQVERRLYPRTVRAFVDTLDARGGRPGDEGT